MNSPERLEPLENEPSAEVRMPAEAAAAPAAAERMFAERSAMLARVERYIPVRLREKLREKIAAERERLARLASAAARLAPRPGSRPAPVLNPDFFELRPLQKHLLE